MVFSGGIGEKSVELRKAVIDQCACLGFGIDDAKNGEASKTADNVFEIGSSATYPTKTLVCKTDEQVWYNSPFLLRILVSEAIHFLCYSWKWLVNAQLIRILLKITLEQCTNIMNIPCTL